MNQRYNYIASVFDEAQRGLRNPTVLLANLKKLHDNSTEGGFQDSFLWHLKRAMVIFEREPAVERIMDFVAKYCTLDSHQRREEEQQQQHTSGSEGDDYSTSGFLQFIFLFLLDSHDANDKAVRFRVCQLINKLLNNMGEGAVIDDDLADRILQSMLVRLTDKFPAVRMQAVAAISRLQDPTDAECPVVSSYLRVMSDDPSAEVRRAVLLNIGLSVHSLDGVLRRTRDVTASVRKLAFCILAVNVNIKALTIAQRVQLLSDGLNDRSDAVREACVALLQSWCKSFDGDVLRLLKCLDVEGCTDIAELVMKTILKGLSKADLQSKHIDSLKRGQESEGPVRINYQRLDPETAFYWRCLGEHLRSLDVVGQELFDELLPEVSGFCDYIQGYVDGQLRETVPDENAEFPQLFITQQLLILVGVMDLSDEVGRKHLTQMVHDMLVLPEIPQSLVEVLHDRYMNLQPDESSRIQELVEIIADVRQPITIRESVQNKEDKRKWELKLAGVGVKLNQLREEMEECVAGQEFARAAELKQQIAELEEEKESLAAEESSFSQTIREEKDDPETLLKCLTIASEMLQGVIRSGLNPTLTTLVETLILPCVQNEDPLVRNMAVKCLGLCALLSSEFARTYLVLFLQVAQFDQEFVRVTALQVVFDLLHTFGFEAFKQTALPKQQSGDPDTSESSQGEEGEKHEEKKEEEEDDTPENPDEGEDRQPTDTAAVVLTILTGILDSESNDLRDVAAEGLAKLLVSGRVLSAKLFSRLLLLWYNPTTEDDDKLRHCLGVFFPVFAFSSRTNQEVVEEAFIPTLETLFSAPVSSPLASVNVSNVAELLVALTDPKNLEKGRNATGTTEVPSSHVSLSLAVANAILSDPAGSGVRVLCKVLTMMDLSGCTQSTVKELKVLTSRTMVEVCDKTSLRSLNKFNTTLSQLSGGKDDDRVEDSQTEAEDETQVNRCAEEEQQEDALETVRESQTSNEDGSDFHRVLQAKADQSQTQTGQPTDMPTIMKTPAHGNPPKPKSKATGKRRGKKTTATDQQFSPSNFIDDETPARRKRYSRKSKTDATGKCNSILAEEDESSEKENTACTDDEDVFCR